MVKNLRIYILLCLLLLTPVFKSNAIDTSTRIVNPHFATLQVYANDNVLNDPVITLDEGQSITIEFDEITDDRRYMRYNLVHCNADWQPSQLVESEFVDGFNEGHVEDYDFSRATTVHYVHYRINIPNDQLRLLVSGNYLLRVYDESEPDNILLQARFMVTEQIVTMSTRVSSVTDVDYNDAHQQLTLELDASNLTVHDPFNDFTVVLTQNNRPDSRRSIIHPLRMQAGHLIYEHLQELIFPAGNEYRRFENISTHAPSMNIEAVAFRSPYYHSFITPDELRANQPYVYDQTQQGKFVIREYNSTRSEIEADYIVTHFTLNSAPMPGYNIYIDGDLVNRRFDDRSLMQWDPDENLYRATMLLKQGSYNYMYLAVPDGQDTPRHSVTAPLEGDFHNTQNKYEIAVYNRLPGQRYDRLVGYFTVNSL